MTIWDHMKTYISNFKKMFEINESFPHLQCKTNSFNNQPRAKNLYIQMINPNIAVLTLTVDRNQSTLNLCKQGGQVTLLSGTVLAALQPSTFSELDLLCSCNKGLVKLNHAA